MMFIRGCMQAAMISAIVFAEVAATPQKEPFEVSWYARGQHLVNVGGRHLNIFCSGSGSPTVILDAGLGENTSSWRFTERGPMTPSQLRSIWVTGIHLHDRIAALSSRGVNFVIDGAGHFVQVDRPSAVISAVDEVVDQARYRK